MLPRTHWYERETLSFLESIERLGVQALSKEADAQHRHTICSVNSVSNDECGVEKYPVPGLAVAVTSYLYSHCHIRVAMVAS